MQVLNFVQTFADMLPDYEIACEHEHSNCVLIAHKKVYTLISHVTLLHDTLGRVLYDCFYTFHEEDVLLFFTVQN